MSPDTFTKAQLARFVYEDAASSGSLDHMLAVAFILRNRVRAGWAGGEWMKVLDNVPAHTAEVTIPRTRYADPLSSEIFRRFLMQVDELYSFQLEDKLTFGVSPDGRRTPGLYYYDATKGAPRAWFAETIIQDNRNHPRIAQVGMLHIFK